MSIGIGTGLSLLGRVISALQSQSQSQPSGGSKVSHFFSKLDKDGSGGISKAELADFKSMLASESAPTKRVDMLEQLFDQIDTDKNGQISPEELKAARGLIREQMQQLSSTDLWTKIFNSIDKDGDGKISQTELQAALQGMQGQGQMHCGGRGMAGHGPASILEYLSANPQHQIGGTTAI